MTSGICTAAAAGVTLSACPRRKSPLGAGGTQETVMRPIITATLTIAALAAAACTPREAAELEHPAEGASSAAAQETTVLDHARTLPALRPEGNQLAIPLASTDAHPWRPIRDGITVTGGPSLRVAYTRSRSQPAGTALVIRPGDLAGLREFTIAVRGNRSQSLSLTLTQADGSVWTTPPIRVAADELRTVRLKAEDITLDPYQNGGGAAGAAFDPAQVCMLTLLDIGGYMSITEPQCEWTIESMKAVLR
jgi:hypothetical protein